LMEKLKRWFPDYTTQSLEALSISKTPMPQWIDKNFLDWLRRILNIPNIQWRNFKSTFKGWHYVRFGKLYLYPPAVVAVCSGFHYDLPWIPNLPDLSLPRISLPEWTRPDHSDIYRNRFEGWFRQVMGDWGVLNWLRDALAKYFMGSLGWVVGLAVNLMWDATFKPHADRWNSIISSFNNETNGLLEDLENRWNMEIVNRFNLVMQDVQERLLGLTRELGVTPIAVRNVTTDGCEVYSPDAVDVFVIVAGELA